MQTPAWQGFSGVNHEGGGPAPEGHYRINLTLDPNRVAGTAKTIENGKTFYETTAGKGIERIPTYADMDRRYHCAGRLNPTSRPRFSQIGEGSERASNT